MRRIAIGDIHGCIENLVDLLEEQVRFTKDDEVFLLGDLISKGVSNREVLDYVIQHINKGYKINGIRGNHEEKILMMYDDIDLLMNYFDKYHLQDLLEGDFEYYLRYISSLPYFIKSKNHLLIHSEINFSKPPGARDLRVIFGTQKLKELLSIKGVENLIQVYGHLARSKSKIESDMMEKKERIGIDGGCVYSDYGYLIALDLDSYELFYSQNTSVQYI